MNLGLAAALLSLFGCASEEAATDGVAATDDAVTDRQALRYVDQGWTAEVRNEIAHVSEGSQLMPLPWLVALDAPGSRQPFTQTLSRFGFVSSDASRDRNPYGLPLGFAEDVDAETGVLYGEPSWVGLTCTACHTSELQIGRSKVRIDGGPSALDLVAFERELLAAVEQTRNEPARWSRFVKRVRPRDPDDLAVRYARFARDLQARFARNTEYIENGQEIAGGPGRLDGLGRPSNDTLCELAELGDPAFRAIFANPANCRGAHPPTSIPHLWGMGQQEFVQWRGHVHSAIGRNIGQLNGTYGQNWVEADANGRPSFRTSADLRTLHAIEDQFELLRAPRWRELAAQRIVAPLDEGLVARGAPLYAQYCASCHPTQPELTEPSATGNRYWRVTVMTPAETGTDPGTVLVDASRTTIMPEIMNPVFNAAYGTSLSGPDNVVPSLAYRALLIGSMVQNGFRLEGISPSEAPVITDCRDGRAQPVVGYKARSLDGVGFTAPYLHNGSVPTLEDLLRPANERPRSFFLGCGKYDAERLGFACDARSERTFEFDTRLPGNSNAGHEYGTTLGRSDRRALVEYIKSIEPPAFPPVPEGALCGIGPSP
jgi:mono/diheme cytochrome c family protein